MKRFFLLDKNHALNVSALARNIAEYCGMDKQSMTALGIAALYHDLGKAAIPAAILNKQAKLTKEECAIMKTHTTLGYNILMHQENNIMRHAAVAALQHHERLDGSGYFGMKGADIDLPVRIISVADVFDALTSNRPYRNAWNLDKALAYFKVNSGRLFDSSIVHALINIINKKFI